MKRTQLVTLMGLLLVAMLLVTPVLAAAPDADPNPGTGSADVTVMNTDAGTASVTAEYYNQDGTLANQRTLSLNGLGSAQFKASESLLPDNWKGSMLLSSTTEVASIATIHWAGNAVGDGIEADSYEGFTTGSIRMNVPFAVYAPNAQYTVLAIQNTESVAASITMKYYNRNGVLDFTISDTIPVNGQKTYDLHTPGAKIPVWANSSYYQTNSQWTGAVIIETGASDQKIAVVANNFWPAYSVAYNASSSGATKLFVPSVERRLLNGGLVASDQLGFSVIIVQNLGGSATDLTFKFVNKDTQNIDQTIVVSGVAAGAAIGCNTRIGAQCNATQIAGLGDTWVGSVVIESSSQQVTAISYSIRPRDNEAGSTTAASAANAGSSVFLPEIYRIGADPTWTLWSLLRLQNVTTSSASVEVRFLNRDGTEVTGAHQSITIPGEKSYNFNLKSGAGGDTSALGSNWSGAVYITSSQPLAAVVENLWNLSQMAAYNGYTK
ncbi:MAG: hypothetical protein NT169_23775 [Chloroflexi bacterium]|nr:hypothetical protein [Chloroflexota bacterium]